MATRTRPRSVKKATRPPRSRLWTQNLFQQLGALRLVLIGGSIVDILLAPNPATPVVYSGWALVPTLIAPVLAPILLQVILLDALMSRVLMSSHQGAERSRYRQIMIVNLVMAAVLTAAWLPYFLAIGR